MDKLKECFSNARKDEEKGKKHKGLLFTEPDSKKAEEYIKKAKKNLEICEIYKQMRLDYKIPEEWFYTLYYCALAILTKFGVESRSQRCTALFLRYLKNNELIEYDDEFIERITVYLNKEEKSDVDQREEARYGSSVKSEEIFYKYNLMMGVCKKAINQVEEIIFSQKQHKIPKKLIE